VEGRQVIIIIKELIKNKYIFTIASCSYQVVSFTPVGITSSDQVDNNFPSFKIKEEKKKEERASAGPKVNGGANETPHHHSLKSLSLSFREREREIFVVVVVV